MSVRVAQLLFVCLSLLSAPPAHAWGERGHDLIARVAARLVAERGGAPLAKPFLDKEHMLGHLANVPDIVWRSAGKDIEQQNAPTHYIDLEYLDTKPTFAAMPTTPAAMLAMLRRHCEAPPVGYVCPESKSESVKIQAAGTAPFRIQQLFQQMLAALQRAKAAPAGDSGDKALSAAVDDALLAGGLMAHYVGDLANPLHTTRDYDGFERGQGGIHSYFETAAVSAQDLDFDAAVQTAARQRRTLARLQAVVPSATRTSFVADPLSVAYALALESFGRLGAVFALDQQAAVTKRGSTERGLKLKAERRPVTSVAARFRPLLIERLTVGAETLAQLWLLAWEQAGKPDLSRYASYAYPVSPTFIPPADAT